MKKINLSPEKKAIKNRLLETLRRFRPLVTHKL